MEELGEVDHPLDPNVGALLVDVAKVWGEAPAGIAREESLEPPVAERDAGGSLGVTNGRAEKTSSR